MSEYHREYLRRKACQEETAKREEQASCKQRVRRNSQLLGIGIAAVTVGLLTVLPMRFHAVADDNGDAAVRYMATNVNLGILGAETTTDARGAMLHGGAVQQFAETLVVDESVKLSETPYAIDARYLLVSQADASDIENAIGNGLYAEESRRIVLYDADDLSPEQEGLYYVALLDDYSMDGKGQVVQATLSCDGQSVDDSEGIIYDDQTGIIYVPKDSRFTGGVTCDNGLVTLGTEETETVISDMPSELTEDSETDAEDSLVLDSEEEYDTATSADEGDVAETPSEDIDSVCDEVPSPSGTDDAGNVATSMSATLHADILVLLADEDISESEIPELPAAELPAANEEELVVTDACEEALESSESPVGDVASDYAAEAVPVETEPEPLDEEAPTILVNHAYIEAASGSSSKTAATTITVTFNKNGGTGTMAKQTMTAGKSTVLKKNTFKRTGYAFKSWNTKKDGKGTTYKNKASVKFTKNVTLYAQWKKNSSTSGTLTNMASGTSSSVAKTETTGDSMQLVRKSDGELSNVLTDMQNDMKNASNFGAKTETTGNSTQLVRKSDGELSDVLTDMQNDMKNASNLSPKTPVSSSVTEQKKQPVDNEAQSAAPQPPQLSQKDVTTLAAQITDVVTKSGGEMTDGTSKQITSLLTQSGISADPMLISVLTELVNQYGKDAQMLNIKIVEKLSDIFCQTAQGQAPSEPAGQQPIRQGGTGTSQTSYKSSPRTPSDAPSSQDEIHVAAGQTSDATSDATNMTQLGTTSAGDANISRPGTTTASSAARNINNKTIASTSRQSSLVQTGDTVAIAGGATILMAFAAGLAAYLRKRHNKA